MQRIRVRLLISVCLAIVFLGGLTVYRVASQSLCVIRTDWPTYTIVRGDTLYRIARRFGTTTAILASANCLPNSNRIYVGQRLRVPGAGGVVTPPGQGGSRPITFQPYENGYMLWWADNGELWVLTGSQNGILTSYPSRSYGGLPDNPFTQPAPAGRVRPIMGFGRVWGNFLSVRSQLGWATAPEQSFISQLVYDPVFRNFTFTVPGARTLFSDGRSWSHHAGATPIPPPPPNPTLPPSGSFNVTAAFQQYENGFMTWRADTGEINAYFGTDGGTAAGFLVEFYGGLPDNPFTQPTPAGRVRPIMGFGRVWGNNEWVRSTLGWATAPEVSYTMSIRPVANAPVLHVTVPIGGEMRWLSNDRNRFWGFTTETLVALPSGVQADADAASAPPAATSEAAESPSPVTTGAAYQVYENGFMVWRADSDMIIVFPQVGAAAYYGLTDYQNLPDNPVTDSVPDGRVLPSSGFGRVWGNLPDVRDALGWALEPEQRYTATVVEIRDLAASDTSERCLSLPDGRAVRVGAAQSWDFVPACE